MCGARRYPPHGARRAFTRSLNTDDESAPSNAVTLVYADRDDLEIEMSGSWNPMGMRGTHSVAVKLAGRLPDAQLVDGEGGVAADV